MCKNQIRFEICTSYIKTSRASLESAIDRRLVLKETEVYRGIGGEYAQNIIDDFHAIGMISVNSFQSSSVDPAQAVLYAGKYGTSASDRVVLKVRLKPGTHALPIGEEKLSSVPTDREVLTKDQGRYILRTKPYEEAMTSPSGKKVNVTVIEVEYVETS